MTFPLTFEGTLTDTDHRGPRTPASQPSLAPGAPRAKDDESAARTLTQGGGR